MNDQLRYSIKRPGAKRKTFAIVSYIPLDRRKKRYQQLDEVIQAKVNKINGQFLSEIIDQHQAETLLLEIVAKEYKRLDVRDMVLKNSTLSAINQKIFIEFWHKIYDGREIVDKESARYDFLKALRLVDPLSLVTATPQELKAKLRVITKGPREMRRAIDRLNQLLKFAGRDFKLQKPAEPLREIRYVTQAELEKICSHIDDKVIRDLAVTLFSSGVRLSESMALKMSDYRDGSLNVDKQVTRQGELKRPKRGKQGRVFLIPFGIDALKRWLACSNKEGYRFALADALGSACRKAFPIDKTKRISPHDLRHSHAIHLLNKGASLTQVSLNLRNRIEVCQKYYTGFSHTGDTIEALKRLI